MCRVALLKSRAPTAAAEAAPPHMNRLKQVGTKTQQRDSVGLWPVLGHMS